MNDLYRINTGALHPEIQEAIRCLTLAVHKHRPDDRSFQLSVSNLNNDKFRQVTYDAIIK